MFVTASDFQILPYNIPDSLDAPNALDDFIPRAEAEILTGLLGAVTYDDFIHALFVDPFADPLVPIPEINIAQKWKDLRDGADYNYPNATVYRYTGIKALLVPSVYSAWLRANVSTVQNLGVINPDVENGTNVGPAEEVDAASLAFNELIGGSCETRNTFFGFMDSRMDVDWPDWLFTDQGYENEFDF